MDGLKNSLLMKFSGTETQSLSQLVYKTDRYPQKAMIRVCVRSFKPAFSSHWYNFFVSATSFIC